MIKVLLVEDDRLWQQGIAALIDAEADMALIGTVDNADEGEVVFDAESPDIVLIDWKINGPRDGLELAAVLAQKVAPQRLIVVSGSPLDQLPENPYGYVPKSKIAADLIQQIRLAMANTSV